MTKTNRKRRARGSVFEDFQWHQRILCDFLLGEEEQSCHHDAENDEADYGGGVPGKDYAAEVEAQEEHEDYADDGDCAEPVEGYEAGGEFCAGVVDVEPDEEHGETAEADGEVEPEDPVEHKSQFFNLE